MPERFFNDESRIIHHRQVDVEPVLAQARFLRETPARMTEGRHVARIPAILIREWCKEAGVKYSDVNARREVMMRKLQSGDFAKFAVDKA